MKRKIKAGSTSHMEPIRVFDSSSTTGGYLTGLTYASSGLTGKYRRQGSSAWTTISIVTATAGTWTSGGFAVPTSGPTGSYELHIPDAAIAAGAKWVEIEFYGVTNMVPVRLFFELDAVDYQTSAFGANTTTPPTAAANATATRSELATELARIDANISTRSTYAGADSSGVTELLTRIPDATPGADGGLPVLSADLTVLAELDAAAQTALLQAMVTEDTGETTAADGSVSKISQGAGSLSVEQAAQLTNIETLVSSVTISTTGFGQLNPAGTLLLKRGHTATIAFTSDTNNIVSDLSVANTKVFLGIRDTAGRQWLSLEGTVTVATGLQSVSFTIPAVKAASMILGIHLFDVVAVYGYNVNNSPPYDTLEPFASGNVEIHELNLDLTNI